MASPSNSTKKTKAKKILVNAADLYQETYTGNDPIEDVVKSAGKRLPVWYPEPTPDHFEFKKFEGTAEPTRDEVRKHDELWKDLTSARSIDKPVIRIIGSKYTSALGVAAAYTGFGAGTGIDMFAYFIDNPVSYLLCPMRKYLKAKKAEDQGKNVSVVNIFRFLRDISSQDGNPVQLKTWLSNLDTNDVWYGLPEGAKDKPLEHFIWCVLGAMYRLLKCYPDLFIERKGNAKAEYEFGLTQTFLESSGEDWNRAHTIVRWYMRRRSQQQFQTANTKLLSAGAKTPSLCWYKTISEVQEEVAGTESHSMLSNYLFSAEQVMDVMTQSGLDDAFNTVAWENFKEMSEGEQTDFIFQQAEAIERFKVHLLDDTEDLATLRQLPPLTDNEWAQLVSFLHNRYRNFKPGRDGTSGHDWSGARRRLVLDSITNANDKEPLMEVNEHEVVQADDEACDDDVHDLVHKAEAAQKKLKADYVNSLDMLMGGNDTEDMSVEEAESITGWEWTDLRIDKGNKHSMKLRVHQLVDIARIYQQLSLFPHTTLLASQCGIGKTVITYGLIALTQRKQTALWEENAAKGVKPQDNVVFRPSLFLCPANLVMDTFSECSRAFPVDLSPKLYYGDRHDYQGRPSIQSVVLEERTFNSFLSQLDPHSPSTGKVVIISSYITFKRRSISTVTKLRNQLTAEDRIFAALHLQDSPMNDDNSGNVPFGDEIEDEELAEKGLRRKTGPVVRTPTAPVDDAGDEAEGDDEDEDEDEDEEEDEDEDEDEDQNSEVGPMYLEEMRADPQSVPFDQVDAENEDARRMGKRKSRGAARKQQRYTILKPNFKQVFNVVVCDEAHLLKNRNTSLHKTVKCLQREKLILCTATPMVNSPIDLLAYTLLAWPTAKPNKTSHNFSYDSFYGPGAAFTSYTMEDDPYLKYLPRHAGDDTQPLEALLARPHENASDIRSRLVDVPPPEGYDPCPLLSPERDGDLFDRLKEAVAHGKKPWVINPGNCYWAIRQFGQGFDASRKVMREVMAAITVKRGMHTPLTLPDGTIVTPGDDIKGARFSIHNLEYAPAEQKRIDEVWEKWKAQLYTIDGETTKRPDHPRGKDLGKRPGDDSSSGKINQRAWRHLLLVAVDLHNYMLLEPRQELCGLVSKLSSVEEARGRRVEGIDALTHATPTKSSKGKPIENAQMGSAQTFTLATRWQDGGMSWLYQTLRVSDQYAIPTNRVGLVRWLTYFSPLMSRLLVQVREWVAAPRGPDGLPNRVVIMAVFPWVQQQLYLALECCGFKTISIRSDHTMITRTRKIADFNDPSTEIDVLVTSMELSAFGLNLHKSCNKGIVVQYPWSANHLMQILGRLPRIGQARVVEWVIYHVSNTLYDRMQTIIYSKYVRQLAVESRIDDSVRSVVAEIAAYSVLFNLFNMATHRYL
ncbi:hypothetical protein Hte_005876 [Hypoxylon texense]